MSGFALSPEAIAAIEIAEAKTVAIEDDYFPFDR